MEVTNHHCQYHPKVEVTYHLVNEDGNEVGATSGSQVATRGKLYPNVKVKPMEVMMKMRIKKQFKMSQYALDQRAAAIPPGSSATSFMKSLGR